MDRMSPPPSPTAEKKPSKKRKGSFSLFFFFSFLFFSFLFFSFFFLFFFFFFSFFFLFFFFFFLFFFFFFFFFFLSFPSFSPSPLQLLLKRLPLLQGKELDLPPKREQKLSLMGLLLLRGFLLKERATHPLGFWQGLLFCLFFLSFFLSFLPFSLSFFLSFFLFPFFFYSLFSSLVLSSISKAPTSTEFKTKMSRVVHSYVSFLFFSSFPFPLPLFLIFSPQNLQIGPSFCGQFIRVLQL